MAISTPFPSKRLPREPDDSDYDSDSDASDSSPAFPFERFPRLPLHDNRDAICTRRTHPNLFRRGRLRPMTVQSDGYDKTGPCPVNWVLALQAVKTPANAVLRKAAIASVSLPGFLQRKSADAVDYRAATAELRRLSTLRNCRVRRLRPQMKSPPLEQAGHTGYKKRKLEEKREIAGEAAEEVVETMTIRRV